MQLRSDSFSNNGRIPSTHVMRAIGGQNQSPHFAWDDPPTGTQSFAFSIVDPHPVARNWVHWLVADIPATARALAAGASGRAMPAGSLELRNSFGQRGYGGPQPPPGTGDHPYVCTVYALSVPKLGLPEGTSLSQFQRALTGKVLAQASMTGKHSQ
jgi:Raf kinase inhibitor-like YbhB/YbcL family protein